VSAAATATAGRERSAGAPAAAERPRIAFVGPGAALRGGIAQFGARLREAVAPRADTLAIGYRRLYPAWTAAGRGPNAPAALGPLDATDTLVAWRPWTWLGAARALRRFRPDVVVVQWWHPLFGPCLRFLAGRAAGAGARVVFVCHNATPHERFPGARALARWTLRRADRLVALSRPVARELRALAPGAAVRVLAHPPNVPVAPAPATGGGTTVLFFGYVRPYKGLGDLIDAVAIARHDLPVELVVAGPFIEPVERYRRQAERLGVAEHVRLLPGYVPDECVGELFARADAVALPYRSATQSGVCALALAAGKPVVATDVGGLAADLGPGAVVVPPGDPAALAGGLRRALSSRERPPAPRPPDWGAWSDDLLAAAAAPKRARRGPRRALLLAGWGIVAVCVALALLGELRDARDATISVSPLPLAAAVLPYALAVAATALAWHALLRGAGAGIGARRSIRIFATAELARFVPGAVLHLLARYRLASAAGVAPEAIAATTLLELGLRLAVGLALALATVPAWPAVPPAFAWGALALLPALACALHPRLLARLVGAGARLLGRRVAVPVVGWGALARAAALTALGWAACAAGAVLVALAVAAPGTDDLVAIAGMVAAAWAIGVATPFAPGGLGVREGVGTALLASVLGLGAAALTMVLVRLLSTVVEVAAALIAAAVDRRAGG
jgi:glycosyltransferase involved in cell wall biosynthesis